MPNTVLPPDPKALWAALVPAQRAVLRHVAAAAGDAGGEAYLVGGPVRDLLLGASRLRDMDVMTTTDARAIAPLFAERTAGAVEKTTEFGTATVALPGGSDPPSLDLATTRTETYARPGALPTVTIPAPSVEDDLRRRDFTVNAMALPLMPDGFGPLLDPFGGDDDLRSGVLRVLHDASFADDPTRLFRLARYAARYGLTAEAHTAALVANAVREKALDSISPARKRREIELGMQEGNLLACFEQFVKFGLLRSASPVLKADGWVMDRLASLAHPPVLWPLWALFVVREGEPAMLRLFADMALNESDVQTPIRLLVRAYTAFVAGEVTPETPFSVLAPLFEKVPEWVVPVFFPPEVAGRVAALHGRLREYAAASHLKGDRIEALGVRRGPEIGGILMELRAAWLDGGLSSVEDEMRYVQERIINDHSRTLC